MVFRQWGAVSMFCFLILCCYFSIRFWEHQMVRPLGGCADVIWYYWGAVTIFTFQICFFSVWSSPIWCWKIGEEEMLSNKGKSPAKEGQLGMIEGECGASTAMMPCLSAPSREGGGASGWLWKRRTRTMTLIITFRMELSWNAGTLRFLEFFANLVAFRHMAMVGMTCSGRWWWHPRPQAQRCCRTLRPSPLVSLAIN